MALEEKIRKSGSPEQLFQEEKKEKAYTVHYLKLPELEREEGHFTDLTPLMDTLFYLNLSFNNLLFFPTKVFHIKILQVLVFRNNPIREIPNDIHTLKSLKKFTVSSNLLSHLPSGLFLLEDLQYLDIAYNGISFIPNDIKNHRRLEHLNIEGKHLSALLSGVLNLPLKYLRIENNFIHPLVWNEKIQNQPPKLTHLASPEIT